MSLSKGEHFITEQLTSAMLGKDNKKDFTEFVSYGILDTAERILGKS